MADGMHAALQLLHQISQDDVDPQGSSRDMDRAVRSHEAEAASPGLPGVNWLLRDPYGTQVPQLGDD